MQELYVILLNLETDELLLVSRSPNLWLTWVESLPHDDLCNVTLLSMVTLSKHAPTSLEKNSTVINPTCKQQTNVVRLSVRASHMWQAEWLTRLRHEFNSTSGTWSYYGWCLHLQHNELIMTTIYPCGASSKRCRISINTCKKLAVISVSPSQIRGMHERQRLDYIQRVLYRKGRRLEVQICERFW